MCSPWPGQRITRDNAPHKYTRSHQDPSVSLMTQCTFLLPGSGQDRAEREPECVGPNLAPPDITHHISQEFVHLPRCSAIRRCHHPPLVPVSHPAPIDPRSLSRQSPLIANFIYVLISFGWLSRTTPPPSLPPRRIRHHTQPAPALTARQLRTKPR